MTGAEAAIALNNNAAAVLIMLTALASGGETVVSRENLWRLEEVPDSGCMQPEWNDAVEVGTTNRTYLGGLRKCSDREYSCFSESYTSNYQITGFTHEAELAELAKQHITAEFPFWWILEEPCGYCFLWNRA